MERQVDYALYLVTDRRWLGGRTLWDCVAQAIRGGVTVVQLREKEISSRDYLELARKVKAVTDRYGVPLIVNDRIDIALAADAGGVHVGPEDLPVDLARRLMGRGKIVGASAATVEEALRCEAEGADYLGVGALYPTATKAATEQVSCAELARIKKSVRIPVVAIGGISADNAAPVLAAGVDGLAVVSAIMAQADPEAAARQFVSLREESGKGAGR